MLLDVAYTDAERRGCSRRTRAPTEATIGSLLPRRLSTPLIPGTTLALELAQRVEPTSWLAFQLRERFDYVWAKTDSLESRRTPRSCSARCARDIATSRSTWGANEFSWAQTADGGLFLADDAPALDQISLSSDLPFALPGFLRALGMAKAIILVADLGPSQVRSHSKLLAYKVSIAPSSERRRSARRS